MEVTNLSDDTEEEDVVEILDQPIQFPVEDPSTDYEQRHHPAVQSRDPSLIELHDPQVVAPVEKGDDTLELYRISALESLLAIRGQSDLSQFVKRKQFATHQVRCLPPRYNGDIIFELPPTTDDVRRGDRVRSMERAKDCY